MTDDLFKSPTIKLKPWGREIWFAQTEKYAGKILEIKAGHRFSLQYHEHKSESQYVFSGRVKFTYGTDENALQEKILETGDKVDIPVGLIHRAEALEDAQIFEVSTPELTDVVKLDDDYGRTGKGNDESLDAKLAQQNDSRTQQSVSNNEQVTTMAPLQSQFST